MSATVRRTRRQSDAVYTALQVISHQMSLQRRVDKLRLVKPNLPEGPLQQQESLTDGLPNQ